MKISINKLLIVTKDGPVTQWNDRIAQIADNAGLPLQNIDWIGTPATVARRVVKYAENYGGNPEKFFLEQFGE